MPRNLSGPMITSITGQSIEPAFLATLTFKSETVSVWSGVGSLTYNGVTYSGVGDLGKVGNVNESIQARADGMTLTLSGIDPSILAESLTDVQIGAPATVYFAAIENGAIVGISTLFSGTMDQPQTETGVNTVSIVLNLENKMLNHARPSARRYTSADQRIRFASDTGFVFVEPLNDIALIWN